MKPNEVLSKEMHVEPLKQGESRTFRLSRGSILGNRTDHDTGQKVPITPAVYQIPPMESVLDPKRGVVQIGNVVSSKPVTRDGRTYFDPVCKPVWFENAEFTVTDKENDTYQYLMRLNGCEDNPFRDPSKKKEFYVVDPVKEQNERIAYDAVEDDAIMLLKELDMEGIQSIAISLADPFKKKVNLNSNIEEIRLALRNIIRNGNPEAIVKASQYTKGRVKIQIIEAEKWGVLKRYDAKRAWYDAEGNKVLEVPVSKDMLDSMVHFITKEKDGAEFYQKTLVPGLRTFKIEEEIEI